MSKNLFPTFEMPDINPLNNSGNQIKYGRSWYFDFETGDFVKDGGNHIKESDGHTAWIQWCIKTCLTERFAFLAYSDAIGVENEEVKQQPNRKASESVLERTITEALLADPRTDSVQNFSFKWSGDEVYISFVAYPKVGLPAEVKFKTIV